jgi:hypothetical protein
VLGPPKPSEARASPLLLASSFSYLPRLTCTRTCEHGPTRTEGG